MANALSLIKHLKRLLWNASQIGLALYGLSMTGYLLARGLTGESWSWVLFANNFIPWWALGGFVAALLGLFSRWRALLVALQLPVMVVFVVWYGDLLWPPQTHPASADTHDSDTIELTAATFNIRASTSDPYRIIDAISALDADIIGLEELDNHHAAMIFSSLAAEYPHVYHFQAASPIGNEMNVGILSRYPILAAEQYTKRTHGRNIRMLVDVQGITISVYLEHPNSPHEAFSPLTYDPGLRNLKVNNLAEALETDTNPVLVLCDCNMTDQTTAYERLSGLLTDSFREAGWGLGFTFPANPLFGGPVTVPVLRIDYIWHSDHFTVTDAYVADDNGTSDHFPVVAELRLQKDSE